MPPKRPERRKAVVATPEIMHVKIVNDFRLEQLERDQTGGAFDAADVPDDLLADASESDVEQQAKRKKPRSSAIKMPTLPRRGNKREKRSLNELLLDDEIFISALVKPSKYPAPQFCSVCLEISKYKCTRCGSRYCSIPCQKTHVETKCVKFNA